MNEDLTTEDVIASFEKDFGGAAPASEPNSEANENTTSEEGSPTAQHGDGTAEGNQTDESNPNPPQQTPPPTQAPDNKAFAAMRVQNKQMQDLLTAIAKQQGVEGTPEEVMSKLREQTLLEQAKKDGIPEPIAKELSKLREQAQNYERFQVQQMARIGFQKVKNDFGLSADELEDFANQLVKEGLNPFREQLDLPMEYLKRNFTSMIQKAEVRGATKEAARLNKVDAQSTAPNAKTSVGSSTPTQASMINTVVDFEAWLEQNVKT